MDKYERLDMNYINGDWRKGKSQKVIESVDPYTEKIYMKLQVASLDDLDEAYESAESHQKGWAETNPFQRAAVIKKAIQIMKNRKEEIVDILVKDAGSTIAKAELELDITLSVMQLAAGFPFQMETIVNDSMIPGKKNHLIRKPLGVVGVIGPFNFPLNLAMRSVAPALAAGNAVVLKPSSQTPVSGGNIIGKVFEEAGLPKGVLQVVHPKSSEIGDAFYLHPVPDMISFTGSTAVGKKIGEVAGREVKKTILELGGNNAMVILDDADIDRAVKGAIYGRFMHSGQICMSTNRIIIDESIFDAFAEKFVDTARSLKHGDPTEKGTLIGPLISGDEVERLLEEIEKAKSEGAEVILEGKREGNVLTPAILKGTNDMTTAQHEMFGPVVTLIPAKDEAEALELANDTEAGLSGAVSSENEKRAFAFAERMETGMVHINDQSVNDEPYIAFGGEKQSGIGRFGREHSLDEFTTWKWISVQEEPRDYPFD
ncbi:aldehyde dehydrogenase (NAD+) [Alkalibacterium subtropicum]|uniref:3-sulfolactaldehyde dehydrogenase n=1 Tax=Alkalibacterium subtropicum TaxID=753702 RepID=A0A1I1LNX4_9LACT|nr:aldehyde dehydrogenase family protein [Alkalibacterium subtropicum]SFC74749.1 aldehyde dehydrogenase (NAD+) [Alkalibacterium subtropicum]